MKITDKAVEDRYYEALLQRNEQYVGVFYVAVKTTSVFCVASCRARKPKRKNVVFYTTAESAIANGFRPCKVCKPTTSVFVAHATIAEALALLQQHPGSKVTDAMLAANGISPATVRRWFKKQYGVTFQAYQRQLKINEAYQSIKQGETATDAAYNHGYASLSGFGYAYKKLVGRSPLKSLSQTVACYEKFGTPLGPMLVAATENGVCLLKLASQKQSEEILAHLKSIKGASIITGGNRHTQQAQQEITDYFKGETTQFKTKLDLAGTPTQQQWWQAVHGLPYGNLVTFNQVAKINTQLPPTSMEAIATITQNPIDIMIPTHRVALPIPGVWEQLGKQAQHQWLLSHEQKFLKAST